MHFLFTMALLSVFASGVSFAVDSGKHTRGVIGILPIPEVYGSYPCEPFQPSEIELFRSPESASAFGRIHVSKPWSFPAIGGCEGLEVSASIDSPVKRTETLPTLEFSYENPGAIVLSRQGAWFEIALATEKAWVHFADREERFLSLQQLYKNALTYLSGDGPFILVNHPGSEEPVWTWNPIDQKNTPIEVLTFQELNGQLWIQVRIPEEEPCSGEKTNLTPATGWLPSHASDGMPSVWFSSRGC